MSRKLLNKALITFSGCINTVVAQSNAQHKNAIHLNNRSPHGFWPLIIIILIALLILSYILTKAIDKRTNK